MNSPLKFWQLNSELSHMKYSHELYQSDLQALKIRLGHFLRMFHVWQLWIKLSKFQWRIHFPSSFNMGHDLFFWNKYWFCYNGSQWGFHQIIKTSWNKYWFGNRSKFDPGPWQGVYKSFVKWATDSGGGSDWKRFLIAQHGEMSLHTQLTY